MSALEHVDVAELIARARALAETGERRILGITGAPGAGKTTVTQQIIEALGPELAAFVPMDGFHLANSTLLAWDRRDRKGAWDTFDAEGYVHLLGRLRVQGTAEGQSAEIIHAPDFDRNIDESVGSALPVLPTVPLIVTEGNYLLSPEGSWGRVAGLLDESWFIDVDDATRLERLTERHVRHGMPRDDAAAWAAGTDQANAERVALNKVRATSVFVVS